ncbi:hypothetical protein HS041_12330 [Planomonospora sp. ID67723]|uniref:hypothetical protein n=1 Tax=Planomonospora sp. ID67723 TaxID=2738134 RepID=UPI0018C40872|nr:hypothetical protein [Planomonospora sp. ID67723]MBG0828556.1 hypothetical protein [Planomonospora sp. ID67723]
MDKIRMRDPYEREFEISPRMLPFWQHREGYTVLDPVSELGETSDPQPATTPGTSQSSKKAASRPASEDKE